MEPVVVLLHPDLGETEKAFGIDIKCTRPESEERFPEVVPVEDSCR